MKQRKVPLRKCVVTGEMYPKKSLVRIVRNKEGEVSIDETGKKSGRGAYIALDIEIAKKAKKKHALDRPLNAKIDEDFYQQLIDYVEHVTIRQELLDNGPK